MLWLNVAKDSDFITGFSWFFSSIEDSVLNLVKLCKKKKHKPLDRLTLLCWEIVEIVPIPEFLNLFFKNSSICLKLKTISVPTLFQIGRLKAY